MTTKFIKNNLLRTLVLISIFSNFINVNAQWFLHNTDNTFTSPFSIFQPSRHFGAITLGDPYGGLFIGGNDGTKPICWHTYRDVNNDYKFFNTNKAMKIEFVHWSHLLQFSFSSNSPTAGGTANFSTLLTLQGDGINEMKLCGNFFAKRVIVNPLTGWCDYVFKPNYALRPLSSLKLFIDSAHHLPEVPNEKTILESGINLGDMQTIQMKKIEELTLYLLQLEEKVAILEEKLEKIEK
ncbi:MAG: hypothetical protein PSX81_14560 [bacterium]|nr:hypothetical protein [bacterium]